MLKDKMKTYNFWISLVSAVLLVARLIAGKFNIEIDSSLVMDVTTGLCGIFVVLGIISAPQKTVTKFIDRPLENPAPLGEDGRVATEGEITSLSSRASVLAKNFSIKFAGEEATVNSEASAPMGEDGRAATKGVISSLLTAPRIDEAETAGITKNEEETAVATQSEEDTAGVTPNEEDMGVLIESEGNANQSINQMINPNDGVNHMPELNEGINQMPNPNDGANQMPNLAELSKEQLIEIICANPQFLNSSKNSN